MNVLSLHSENGAAFPAGMRRLEYQSKVDGLRDWALLLPGRNTSAWIVVAHGHGSSGDQLYTRPDIRRAWLDNLQKTGAGILTVNLRGNAWMSPAAAEDLRLLLQWMRAEQGLQKTLFVSGSMGGTSNLIYATLHPEDVHALVAMGAVADIGSYYAWCLKQHAGIVREIAMAIQRSYTEATLPLKVTFEKHSAMQNATRLTMPLYFIHGEKDVLMPVSQARDFAEKMKSHEHFSYHEIPGGNHDSPLWDEGVWRFINIYWPS